MQVAIAILGAAAVLSPVIILRVAFVAIGKLIELPPSSSPSHTHALRPPAMRFRVMCLLQMLGGWQLWAIR